MPYNKNLWVDHVVEHPRTYKMVDGDTETTVEMIPDFGDVLQQGTPLNAVRMNRMEDAIEEASNAVEELEGQAETVQQLATEAKSAAETAASASQNAAAQVAQMGEKLAFLRYEDGSVALIIGGYGLRLSAAGVDILENGTAIGTFAGGALQVQKLICTEAEVAGFDIGADNTGLFIK